MLERFQRRGDERRLAAAERAANDHQRMRAALRDLVKRRQQLLLLGMGQVEIVRQKAGGQTILQAWRKRRDIPVFCQIRLTATQVGDQALHRLVSVSRGFFQQAQNDRREHAGHRGPHLVQRPGNGSNMVMRPLRLPAFAGLKGQRAGQQFIQHDAQAVEIAAAVDAIAGARGVLRRHIGQRPAGHRQARLAGDLWRAGGQAESGQPVRAAGIDKKVAGFDIAVHQPLGMHLPQRRTQP